MDEKELTKNAERLNSLWERACELSRMGKHSPLSIGVAKEMRNCAREIIVCAQTGIRLKKEQERKEGKERKEAEKRKEGEKSAKELISNLTLDSLKSVADGLLALCEDSSVNAETQRKIHKLLTLGLVGCDDNGVFVPLPRSEIFKNAAKGKDKWSRVPDFISSLKESMSSGIWVSVKSLELAMTKNVRSAFAAEESSGRVSRLSFNIVSRLHKSFPNMVYVHWSNFNYIRFSVSPDGKLTLCA